jgi:hypothetical protein
MIRERDQVGIIAAEPDFGFARRFVLPRKDNHAIRELRDGDPLLIFRGQGVHRRFCGEADANRQHRTQSALARAPFMALVGG